MKALIWIGLSAGGAPGGLFGSLLDNGNFFGIWGIIGSTLGGIVGIWAGYKIAQSYL